MKKLIVFVASFVLIFNIFYISAAAYTSGIEFDYKFPGAERVIGEYQYYVAWYLPSSDTVYYYGFSMREGYPLLYRSNEGNFTMYMSNPYKDIFTSSVGITNYFTKQGGYYNTWDGDHWRKNENELSVSPSLFPELYNVPFSQMLETNIPVVITDDWEQYKKDYKAGIVDISGYKPKNFDRPVISNADYDGQVLTITIPFMYDKNGDAATSSTVEPWKLAASYNIHYHNINGKKFTSQCELPYLEKQYIKNSEGKTYGYTPYIDIKKDNNGYSFVVVIDKENISKNYGYGQNILYDDIDFIFNWDCSPPDHSYWTSFKFDFNDVTYTNSDVFGNDATEGVPSNNNNGNTENIWVQDTKDYNDNTNGGILDFLKSGLGFFGPNGFFALLGNTFTFIPSPILNVITSGVAITMLLIIYKLFRG